MKQSLPKRNGSSPKAKQQHRPKEPAKRCASQHLNMAAQKCPLVLGSIREAVQENDVLLEFEPSQLSTELCTDELLEELPQEVIDALDFDESEAVLAAFVDQDQPLQVDPFDLLLDEDPLGM